MKYYIIIVEGAHDIALIEKLLIHNKIGKRIQNRDDLDDLWYKLVPDKYPFDSSKLDRIAPIPSFVQGENIGVAIKNAGSDLEIFNTLYSIMQPLLRRERDMIDGVMVMCDADTKSPSQKIKDIIGDYTTKGLREDFTVIEEEGELALDVGIKKIPIETYVFPNNNDVGNLENLLLEVADIEYPDLLSLASQYINNVPTKYSKMKKQPLRKKALIGCITNIMKPGKANQVSIGDDNWVSDKTIVSCQSLKKLNQLLVKFVS